MENLREVLGETFEGNEVQNLLRLSYVERDVFFVQSLWGEDGLKIIQISKISIYYGNYGIRFDRIG